jgi:hypothetical protein
LIAASPRGLSPHTQVSSDHTTHSLSLPRPPHASRAHLTNEHGCKQPFSSRKQQMILQNWYDTTIMRSRLSQNHQNTATNGLLRVARARSLTYRFVRYILRHPDRAICAHSSHRGPARTDIGVRSPAHSSRPHRSLVARVPRCRGAFFPSSAASDACKLGTCIGPMYTRTRVRTTGHRPSLFARFLFCRYFFHSLSPLGARVFS